MPSNLRSTTRECVHLVTCGHFRSREKDGGHTIRSADADLMALWFREPELWPLGVLHCGNRDFWPFTAPV